MTTPHLHLRDVLAKYSATLVLGSSSRSRQAILRQANVPFTVSIADIDERCVGDRARDDPAALTAAVAKAKADAIVAQPGFKVNTVAGSILLASDQVVVRGHYTAGAGHRQIFEKPANAEELREMVAGHSGGQVSTCGTTVLLDTDSGKTVSEAQVATVTFRTFPDTLVDAMIAESGDAMMGCAGGLMVEHPMLQDYITSVDGGLDSVMGLDLTIVAAALDRLKRE